MTTEERTKEIINSLEFERFFISLLSMYDKYIDRDNTIATVFSYDSFEEFYKINSMWFLVHYEDEEKLLKAILKIFFKCQLNILVRNGGSKEICDEFVCESVEQHATKMINAIKKFHKQTYEDIIEKNKINFIK